MKYAVKEQKCFIRGNRDIKDYVILRMAELNMGVADILAESKRYKLNFDQAVFSRWINAKGYVSKGLTQKQVLWLCHRLGIEVHMKIEMKENFNYIEARVDTQKFINQYNEL